MYIFIFFLYLSRYFPYSFTYLDIDNIMYHIITTSKYYIITYCMLIDRKTVEYTRSTSISEGKKKQYFKRFCISPCIVEDLIF